MKDVSKECGKFILTVESLIGWIIVIPAGDCVAESRVGVGKGGVRCQRVEFGLVKEAADPCLDRRCHDDGDDCFGVVV